MIPKLIDPERRLYSASGPVIKVTDKAVDGKSVDVEYSLMPHDPSVFVLKNHPAGEVCCLVEKIPVDLAEVGAMDSLLSQVYASACVMGNAVSSKFDADVAARASWPAELHRHERGVECGQVLGDVLISLMKALPPEELARLSENRMDRLMNYGNRFPYQVSTLASDHQEQDPHGRKVG